MRREQVLRQATIGTARKAFLEAAAVAHAMGTASEAESAALEADPLAWEFALRRLVHATDEAALSALHLEADWRELVLADLAAERRRLDDQLRRRFGTGIEPPAELAALVPSSAQAPKAPLEPAPIPAGTEGSGSADPLAAVAEPILQASWGEGRLVVWAGCPQRTAAAEELDELLRQAEASGIGWESHAPVVVPSGLAAAARSAPLSQTLGWLVGVGAGQGLGPVGASLRWVGEVALWGTELVARGHMVPVVRAASVVAASPRPTSGRHRVRWVPALVARDRLHDLVTRMPTAFSVLQKGAPADTLTRSLLAAVVDAITRTGASRWRKNGFDPASPALAETRAEVSEAVLSGLDGRPFVASYDMASKVAEDLKRWAAPVTSPHRVGLLVRLDPPGPDGGWLLSVEATGVDKNPMPVEHALVVASGNKSQQVEAQLRRLERLLPALKRPSTRRGQVFLDTEEATELMFELGRSLADAGFEVYLPQVSRRRPSPQLKLYAESVPGQTQVGLAQLADVRWSVVFDELELTAAEIARLAKEAQPIVQVRGRWVRLERADVLAAAEALSERAGKSRMSGAEILRHAVGLEGHALAGPVRVDGSGWAAELLHNATSAPPAPVANPEGFSGQLRTYQAEAAGWLAFLDRAGLGGCLAMDMGLGKTPTLLAHLLTDRGNGPTLVICPPAVLGNWATEAARFTKPLRVVVHHGPGRAQGEEVARLAASHDLVLTTYATAVRDVEDLSRVSWRRVVVDEAQVIKNYASDTAQELRRLPAQSRLALTGTPIENGLGDLWAILDWTNPGLVGPRAAFIERLSERQGGAAEQEGARPEEAALRALNGLLVFRRTKSEPEIAAELPDKVDKLDQCSMTSEQIGLYQAVLDRLLQEGLSPDTNQRKGQVLAAITALKQICNHPAAYLGEEDAGQALEGRSGKLARLEEIVAEVFSAGERILIFTHFARWGEKLAAYLSERTGVHVGCYHGGLSRSVRDELVRQFQSSKGAGALVLSIKAGGSGLNLTAANHVVLYDRWWNPAVEDQARDRAWRIGQRSTVVCHRLVCPGTVDERVEEIVAGKRRVAGLVLPARSSLSDLDAEQIRLALGLRQEELVEDEPTGDASGAEVAA